MLRLARSSAEARDDVAEPGTLISDAVGTTAIGDSTDKFAPCPVDDPLIDLMTHKKELQELNSTEREAVVKSRVGQGLFRERLIALWSGCAVTGLTTASLLRASHAKAWRDCTNAERLDPYNGLLLIPNLDHLFDRHLIGFDCDGRIRISCELSESDQRAMGVNKQIRLRRIIPETQQYLAYHLREVKQSGTEKDSVGETV